MLSTKKETSYKTPGTANAKDVFSYSRHLQSVKMQLLGILFLFLGLTYGSPLLKMGSTRGDEEIYMTTVKTLDDKNYFFKN